LSAYSPLDHSATRRELTPDGEALLDRLVAARSERLAELLRDWSPDQHRDLATLIDRLAHEATAPGAV
jgi:DNA-binding MarR family transcriptional regulator